MGLVLVIEDNLANLKLVRLLLESAGHTVRTAADAEAGIALARNAQPDLVLMDIQLPGMDGLAAIALLKADETTRAIPVIALTALAMKGDEERIPDIESALRCSRHSRRREFLAAIAAELARQ